MARQLEANGITKAILKQLPSSALACGQYFLALHLRRTILNNHQFPESRSCRRQVLLQGRLASDNRLNCQWGCNTLYVHYLLNNFAFENTISEGSH